MDPKLMTKRELQAAASRGDERAQIELARREASANSARWFEQTFKEGVDFNER